MAQAERAGERVRLGAEAVLAARRTSWSRCPAGRGSRGRSPAPSARAHAPTWQRRRHRVERRSPAPARAPASSSRFSANAGPDQLQARPAAPRTGRRGSRCPAGPARLSGTVSTSQGTSPSGSSIRSPIVNATVGEVGVAITSTLGERRVEVLPDQRPHLLGLAVVGVVVAGRERVGAEHDPALDLGAEALGRACARTSRRSCRRAPRAAGRSGRRRSGPGWPTPRRARSGSRRAAP